MLYLYRGDRMNTETTYLHEQVYNTIKKKIINKEYKFGAPLPREIDLMKIHNVSRHTIRKATDRLFNEGYIYKVKGTGTFVKSTKADYKLSNMSSFSEILDKNQGNPNSIVREAREINLTDRLMSKLNIVDKKTCYYVERIRRNGKETLCFEKTFISKDLCPNIIDYITPNASLYKLYEDKYNLNMSEGSYNLEAINSTPKIAKLLDVEDNSAILYMSAVITLENGKPLYYVEAYYVGSRYTFSTHLKR